MFFKGISPLGEVPFFIFLKIFQLFFEKPEKNGLLDAYHLRGVFLKGKIPDRTLTTEYTFVRHVPCMGKPKPRL